MSEAPAPVYEHPWAVRFCHWANAIALIVLVMSGLQIFNARPDLYWGHQSNFDAPLLSMTARNTPDGTVWRGRPPARKYVAHAASPASATAK